MAELTHYELLALDRTAEDKTIRAAVRLQRRTWTQRQGLPSLDVRHEADRMISRIAEAEKILTDVAQRARYDATLAPIVVPVLPVLPVSRAEPSPVVVPETREQPSAPLSPFAAATGWALAHKKITGAIALSVVVLLFAVGIGNSNRAGSTRAQPSADGNSETQPSPTESAASPEPTAPPTSIDLHTTLSIVDESVYAGNQPYNFLTGLSKTFAASSIVGAASSNTSQTYAGTGVGARIVVWSSILTPAAGLTPESYVQKLSFVNPNTLAITATAQISTLPKSPNKPKMFGSPDGTVLLSDGFGSFSSDAAVTTAFSVVSGAQLWQHSGYVERIALGLALMQTVVSSAESPYGMRCKGIDAIKPSTGATVWSLNASQFAKPTDACQRLEFTGELKMSSSAVSPTYIPIGEDAVYQTATGAKVSWRQGDDNTDGTVDPVTGLVYSGYASNEGVLRPALVYDPLTGANLFSLAGDQAKSLDFYVSCFFNGLLYVTTTAEHLVIDAHTGATVSKGWTSTPIGYVEGWSIYSDGRMEKVK